MKILIYIWNFIKYRFLGGKERQAEAERQYELDKADAQTTKDNIRTRAEAKAEMDREKTIDELQDKEDF